MWMVVILIAVLFTLAYAAILVNSKNPIANAIVFVGLIVIVILIGATLANAQQPTTYPYGQTCHRPQTQYPQQVAPYRRPPWTPVRNVLFWLGGGRYAAQQPQAPVQSPQSQVQ